MNRAFAAAAGTSPLMAGLAGLTLLAAIAPLAGPRLRGGSGFDASAPMILCADPTPPAVGRSATTIQSEPLAGHPGKRMTTQLVRFPPGTSSPRHVHGGDLTVYVLKGTVRSQHAGQPLATFHAGQVFYEPRGSIHVYIDNPSATESAELLAVMVHDEGAALTTFLD